MEEDIGMEQKMEETTLLAFLEQRCHFEFTKEEVAALFRGGFNTKAALAGVTREDLAAVQLRPAAVKMLVSAFSGASGLQVG
jgi:hypothetical protein